MKKFLALLAFAFAAVFGGVAFTACTAPPSARVVQVQSLKAVGESAESAVTLSAQLYRAGTITPAQARAVMDFYDGKFQPAFRLAVAAVNANLDSLASPDVAALAGQLSALVASYLPKSPAP